MYVLPNADVAIAGPKQVRQPRLLPQVHHTEMVSVLFHHSFAESRIPHLQDESSKPRLAHVPRSRNLHSPQTLSQHPIATLHRGLASEWNDLLDQTAYARCIAVVANHKEDAEADFNEAQRIDTRHIHFPHLLWPQAEVDVVVQALESRKAHLKALRRLLAEQKRMRPDGIINASKRSRDWMRAEMEASKGRLRRLMRMQEEAQRSHGAARRSVPAVQGGGGPVAVSAPAIQGGAGPVAGQDNEGDDGEQAAQEGNEEPGEREGTGEQVGDGAEERNGAEEVNEEQEENGEQEESGVQEEN